MSGGETFQIKCPCCDATLVIRRRDGKLLETRKPIREDSSGDRFDDALRNVRERKGALDKKVEAARRAEKERSARLDALFKDGLNRAKEEGDDGERPANPLDLD
jgi:hypothetical protein